MSASPKPLPEQLPLLVQITLILFAYDNSHRRFVVLNRTEELPVDAELFMSLYLRGKMQFQGITFHVSQLSPAESNLLTGCATCELANVQRSEEDLVGCGWLKPGLRVV